MEHIQGDGPTLVLVPGLQGRWEYVRPAVEALARYFTVVTFSLDEVRRSRAANFDTINPFGMVVSDAFGGIVGN